MAALVSLSLAASGVVTIAVPAPEPAAAAAAVSCADAAPSETEARAIAVACGREVVVESSRTESSQVVAAADGTLRLQAYAAPQRVRRADGSWTPISTVLGRRADGSVGPAATLAEVTFSGGGSGPLVTWREAGSTFTLSWPFGSLPAPRLAGATATYESVLADVNLHVTATAEGYTHVVEVRTPEAARRQEIRSLWYALGGTMRVERSGEGLRLVDQAGRAVATSAPAVMWDSSRDPARAGEVLPEVAAARAAGRTMSFGEPATAVEAAVTSRTAPARSRPQRPF